MARRHRRCRRVSAVLALAALLHFSLANRARAEVPPPTPSESSIVLIVRSAGDDRFVARLRGELASSGYRIVELGPEAGQTDASLSRLAALVSAAGAVRVRPDAASVDVWVGEPGDGAAGDVETITSSGPHLDERVLALRATEAMRARGLRVARRPPEQPAMKPAVEAAAPALVTPAARERAAPGQPTRRELRGFWLELGPSSTISPGGIGPSFDAALALHARLTSDATVGGFALMPLLDQRLAGAEGTTRVSTWLAGAFTEVTIHEAGWDLDLGGGIAGAIANLRGEASGRYLGATDRVLMAAPFVRASAHLEIGGGWRMGVAAMGGATLPELSVRFAEREVATWGRPLFLLGTVGIEAPLVTWATRR